MLINIVLLIQVALGTLNSCSADDDAEIGCNAECVGPDHIMCQRQLLRDDNVDLSSSVNMEIYFEDPVTIIGVRVVFASISDTPNSISIGMTGIDTSDQTYDGTASYSIEASTSSIVVSETLDLLLHDPYIESNSWLIALEMSEGYIVAIESLTVYGGVSPILSEWGEWSKCACAIQIRTRSCYSSSTTICNGYPLSENQACPTCTCSLNNDLYCSDFIVSQSDKPGQTECERILDDDEGSIWDYTFSSSSDSVDLTLEFRDTNNNDIIYNVETVGWNLTETTLVDDLLWWLIFPSDSSATLTEAVDFKRSGPHAVSGTQRVWYWNIPIETRLILLRFEPRSSTTSNPYIGINEIQVTGFRTEDYPQLDCYEEEWIDTSNPNQWVIPVLAICGGILLLMFCSCSLKCCCMYLKGDVVESPSKSNQLKDNRIIGSEQIGKKRESSSESSYYTGAKGNVERTQYEGPSQSNVFNDLEQELERDGIGSFNMVTRDSTNGSEDQPGAEGAPHDDVNWEASQVNYLAKFSDRVALKQILASPEAAITKKDARKIVAQLRRLPLAGVPPRDFAINALVGLNSAALRQKLKKLTKEEVDLLEGRFVIRLGRESASSLDMQPVGEGPGTTGARHIQPVSNNLPKRVITLRDELPDLPDCSSTSETDEEAERILSCSISRPVSHKMSNIRISKIHEGSQRLEGPSQPIPRVVKRISRGSSIGRWSHGGSMEIRVSHPEVNSYRMSSVSNMSRISRIGKPVRILVSLGEDKRTFRPEKYDCFVAFIGWVQDTYVNLPKDGNWRLEYQDSDGDVIRIASDSDIREALLNTEEANFSKLRVKILAEDNNSNYGRQEIKEGDGNRSEASIIRREPRQSSKGGESGRTFGSGYPMGEI